MIHGIVCDSDTCHYARIPEDTIRVFGDAINMTLQEEGIMGLLKRGDTPGLSQDN